MRGRVAVVVAVAALAAVAALGLARRHSPHPPARAAAAATTVRHTVRLNPPGPIPGYLLIADRGNDRMLLVDSARHILWQYPPPGSSVAMPFRFDDDTFFGPKQNVIISNQEDQHTIQIISFPAGKIVWRYGHVNQKGSAPGYLNTPDDAYLLPNGLVTVADAYNCRVLFIDRAHRVVKSYGRAGDCTHAPPRALGAINGATPLADGGTLVSEINGSWIDDFSASGRLRWSVQAPVSYPSDPQLLGPNRILLADYATPGHALIIDRHGRVLWRYGPSSGPGELNHPSLAFRIAPGLVAINDDYRDRVVIVSIRTHRIVWQYGHTDQAGTAPGFLNTPDGMDLLPTADAQRSPVLRRLLAYRPVPQLVRSAPFHLPAPVERAVAVQTGKTIVIAGGLDSAQSSTDGVFRVNPATGGLTSLGTVPEAFHDATGALLRGALFVFGGGASTSSSSVQRFDLATHRGSVVAHLPHPLSDLASATVGGTVYLVGGYDGTTPRREIYATRDGLHFRLAGMLPQGLRYAAVGALDGKLVIAGGVSPAGTSDAVYSFDPAGGSVRRIGTLPQPLSAAAAVSLPNAVDVVGGGQVIRVDAGGVHRIGTAPVVSNAAVAGSYLIGGDLNGRALAGVLVLRGT